MTGHCACNVCGVRCEGCCLACILEGQVDDLESVASRIDDALESADPRAALLEWREELEQLQAVRSAEYDEARRDGSPWRSP